MINKLNVHLSSDLPNHSSLIASCGLRGDLPNDLEALHVRQAIAVCLRVLAQKPAAELGNDRSAISSEALPSPADDRLRDRPPATRKHIAMLRRLEAEIPDPGGARADRTAENWPRGQFSMCGVFVLLGVRMAASS
jgi:hypothetical protein